MYLYRKVNKEKGFITLEILMIFFLVLFLTSILFKLSIERIQKADYEKQIIENNEELVVGN